MEKVVCMVHSKQDGENSTHLSCKTCRALFVNNVLAAQSKRANVVAAWLESKARRNQNFVPQYARSR
jgi:hypothetical protein